MPDLLPNHIISPLPLVPGKLYRLGGVVPIDGRLSWRRAGLTGYEPINAYLLLEQDNALIVGTGVRLHRELIIEQIRSLLGKRQLHIYAGRNEADEIGNLAAFIKAFTVRDAWFARSDHLWQGFAHQDFTGEVPPCAELTWHWMTANSRCEQHCADPNNDSGQLAFDPAQQLELLSTRLSVLGSSWLYDGGTRTLFCSDFFSEGRLEFLDQPALMPHSPAMQLDEVRNHIFTRFRWMAAAHTAPLIAELQALLQRPIERLAPCHGSVIEGATNVRYHIELAIEALHSSTTFATLEQHNHD